MDFLYIAVLALVSIVILFIITRLLGNKQVGQLNMFDYITGITIGSIAAELATDLEDFHLPLTALVVFGAVSLLISVLITKSLKIRGFISGKPYALYNNGELYEKNLKKAHIDVNEFQTELRAAGYFDLNDIQTVVLEPNGKVSVIPKVYARPVTNEDKNKKPEQEFLTVNLIIDGKVLLENLSAAGYDEAWLKKQLKKQNINEYRDVLLAFVDNKGKLSAYRRNSKESEVEV